MKIRMTAPDFLALAVEDELAKTVEGVSFDTAIEDARGEGILAMDASEPKSVTASLPSFSDIAEFAKRIWQAVQPLVSKRPEASIVFDTPTGERFSMTVKNMSEENVMQAIKSAMALKD